MSFMIGCGSHIKKKEFLEVESFDEETFFNAKDIRSAISNNVFKIKMPPMVKEMRGGRTDVVAWVMEIKTNRQVFFTEFCAKPSASSFMRSRTNMLRSKLGVITKETIGVYKGEQYPSYLELYTTNNIRVICNRATPIAQDTQGIFIDIPRTFLNNYPDTTIHFGKTRMLKAEFISIPLPYNRDGDISYLKDDLLSLLGDDQKYDFKLNTSLFHSGYGLVVNDVSLLPDPSDPSLNTYKVPSSVVATNLLTNEKVTTLTKDTPYEIKSEDFTIITSASQYFYDVSIRTHKKMSDMLRFTVTFIHTLAKG